MKKIAIFTAGCALAGFSMTATAAGDAGAGQQKSAVCAACHQADGNSVNPQWPNLASQHASYISKQLQNYKSGERENAIMQAQVAALSDEDMSDLAAYFAGNELVPGTADPKLIKLGENLYRGGDIERGIPSCTGCHGPAGKGNPAAKFPAVAGQHAEYTATQLKAFRSMERANDPNEMMRNIAIRLTDPEIAAVASYIQGLRRNPVAE
jgi:cytochrome c553